MTEIKPGTTRINALTQFLRTVHCSQCGASADEGLKLVESRVEKDKARFTLKCFNLVEKKGVLGGASTRAPCGKTTLIELPLDWGASA